jgi:kumamolisin
MDQSPSDDPNVTVVGRNQPDDFGFGRAVQSESTWSGSGGGISTSYPIPSYQQGLNMVASGGSATMRNIPDVALTAAVQMF